MSTVQLPVQAVWAPFLSSSLSRGRYLYFQLRLSLDKGVQKINRHENAYLIIKIHKI